MDFYGAKTNSGELIVMSISDLEPVFLQGPERNEFLANIKLWEAFPENFENDDIVTWYTLNGLEAELSR